MANPTKFAPRCRRLYITQAATVGANAGAQLSPPFKLEGKHNARLLYGIVTTGTVTDAAILLEQDGQRITPTEGIPLEVVADLTPPDFNERRADLVIYPGSEWAPTLNNETGVQASWSITWVLERIEDGGAP